LRLMEPASFPGQREKQPRTHSTTNIHCRYPVPGNNGGRSFSSSLPSIEPLFDARAISDVAGRYSVASQGALAKRRVVCTLPPNHPQPPAGRIVVSGRAVLKIAAKAPHPIRPGTDLAEPAGTNVVGGDRCFATILVRRSRVFAESSPAHPHILPPPPPTTATLYLSSTRQPDFPCHSGAPPWFSQHRPAAPRIPNAPLLGPPPIHQSLLFPEQNFSPPSSASSTCTCALKHKYAPLPPLAKVVHTILSRIPCARDTQVNDTHKLPLGQLNDAVFWHRIDFRRPFKNHPEIRRPAGGFSDSEQSFRPVRIRNGVVG